MEGFKSYADIVNHYVPNLIRIDEDRLFNIDPEFSGWIDDPENEGEPLQIFEYCITDVNDYVAKEMEDCFEGVYLEYSNALGRWILLVPHLGTDWKYVYMEMTEKGKAMFKD